MSAITNNAFVRWLGSYGLCVTILGGLFLLTALGTWAQAEEGLYAAQTKYFDSFFLTEHIPIFGKTLVVPLPGAVTLMALLAVNLFVGGFVRIRKNKRTFGVLVIHAGIGLLLLAGLVKREAANEGYVRLYEGEQATEYRSYHDWEVCVRELLPKPDQTGLVSGDEWFVDQVVFLGLEGDEVAMVRHPELPFDLHLRHFVPNARVHSEKSRDSSIYPVVDGYRVVPDPVDPEAERNFAALYAEVVAKGAPKDRRGRAGILAAMERYPFTVDQDGRLFAIELRKRRYSMPFTIEQVKFTMEEHPRTRIPSVYSSDILRKDLGAEEGDSVHISMNRPLREDGLVVFQSGYGPKDAPKGTPLFSIFAVVRNPSDRWPEYSCWVIAAGMLIAFGQRLVGYVNRQKRVLREEVTE